MKGYESPGRAPAWATARSRRHSRLTYFIGIALTLLVIVWHFHVPSTPQELSDSSNLHILVPVVGRNINLCKMFLSAFANGYPTPILVGWNDNGEYDQEKQLEKVTTIKNYLTKLQRAGDHGDDIVLIVDGIDVMFQLGPEVLLSNYFETLQRLDNHVQQEYGRPDIHHTILFGAEKHCWPDPLMAPSCWMMPRSTVHPYAYGPYTSGHLTHSASTRAQPRWLNPGTSK
ncbi:hypothetical protein ANO11243_072040 [Dothideomycetidae sp. 11243]|nr:hypothetical protein ANO11243_072040 [fungal sp. No.11243]